MFYSTIINLLSISDIRKSPFSAKILKTGGGGAPLLPKRFPGMSLPTPKPIAILLRCY